MSACLAIAAVAGEASGATATSAGASCRVLPAASLPLPKLIASYRSQTTLPARLALAVTGPRHYGICGSTHYAWALFGAAPRVHLTVHEQVLMQDQSAVWREAAGKRWVDEPEDQVCTLPRALIDAWKVRLVCG